MSCFWVIGLSINVRSIISKYVRCSHPRGRLQQQKMANLSRDRMSKEASFLFCGVDMFGPLVMKNCCKELKQYGHLYTCLSSRVIRIEVTYSLNTDSFIMFLREFINSRGNIHLIRSESESNFTGASSEMIQVFQKMDHSRISSYL